MSSVSAAMNSDRPLGALVSAAVLSPSLSPSPLPSHGGGRRHTVSPTSIFLLIGIWIFIVLLGCRLMFTMMGLMSNCFCCCCAIGPARRRSSRQRGAAGELIMVEERVGRRARRRGGAYDTAMAGYHQHTRTISEATIETFPVRTFKAPSSLGPTPAGDTPTLPLHANPPSTPSPNTQPPGSAPPTTPQSQTSSCAATPDNSDRPSTSHAAQSPPCSPTTQQRSRTATPPLEATPAAPPAASAKEHTTIHIPADPSSASRPDTAHLRDTSPPPSHRRAHSLDVKASTSDPAAPQADVSEAAGSRATKLYTVAAPERISTSTGSGAGSGEGLRAEGRPPGGELARAPSTGVLAQLGAGLDWLRARTAGPAVRAEPSAAPPPDGTACPICLGDYAEGDQLRTMPCKHEFHVECIDPWMASHPTCPICRDDLLQYDVADSQAVDQPQAP